MVLSRGRANREVHTCHEGTTLQLTPYITHSRRGGWGEETGATGALLRKLGTDNHMRFLGPCQGLIGLEGVGGRGRAASSNRGKGVSLPVFPSATLRPDTANKPGGALKPNPRNCVSQGPRTALA